SRGSLRPITQCQLPWSLPSVARTSRNASPIHETLAEPASSISGVSRNQASEIDSFHSPTRTSSCPRASFLTPSSIVEHKGHQQVHLVLGDLVGLDVDALFLDPCAGDVSECLRG